MTPEQAVERYVALKLRAISRCAGVEIRLVDAARRRADDDALGRLVGQIAQQAFRRELWRASQR